MPADELLAPPACPFGCSLGPFVIGGFWSGYRAGCFTCNRWWRCSRQRQRRMFPFRYRCLVSARAKRNPTGPRRRRSSRRNLSGRPCGSKSMIRRRIRSIRSNGIRKRPTSRRRYDNSANDGRRIRMFNRVRRTRVRAQVFHIMSNNRLLFYFYRIRQATIDFHISNGRMSSRDRSNEGISFRGIPSINLAFCSNLGVRNAARCSRNRCTRTSEGLMASGRNSASCNAGRYVFTIAAPSNRRGARCASKEDYRRGRSASIRIGSFSAFVP